MQMNEPYRMRKSPPPPGPGEEAGLPDAVKETLEEGRTILPGIQAFIGFQLVAVFSAPFWEKLRPEERWIHLAAIVLNFVAIVFLLTPSIYHRRRESGYHSEGFVNLSSRMLSASTFPLVASVALDIYVLTRLISDSVVSASVVAVAVFAFAMFWWLALPYFGPLRDRLRR